MIALQTEVGDVYDCIDILKQPSLDHPLLQNHKIQVSYILDSPLRYYNIFVYDLISFRH